MSGSQSTGDFLHEYLGILQMLLWLAAMVSMNYEPYKFNSASGLSLNMSLINLVGATFLLAQNYYGFYFGVDYWGGIQWFSLVIAATQFLGWGGAVFTGKYLKSRNNEFGKFGLWLASLGVLFIVIYLHADSNLERIMKMCGFVHAVLYLFSFIPQIELITRNKSTRGWSLMAIFMIMTINAFAIIEAFTSYSFNKADDKTLAGQMNWGKVFSNFFSILCNGIYLFQHKLYSKNKTHQNKYVVDIEELKVAFLQSKDVSDVKS